MSLVVTNTLTGKKEPFSPLHSPHVRMYACGPTVYDDPHIGHIRGAFVFDVIRKHLQYLGYSVKFIRNITDVDDKIIEKARQEKVTKSQGHKVTSKKAEVSLKQVCEQVSLKYTNAYHDALEKLGIEPPDEEPRATQQIPKMIQMIEQLIQKGIAYPAEGNVYFSVGEFPSYGKLSHQSPDQLLKGHRIEPGSGKKNPLDFALWKSAKPEEPSWPSPWGAGRPGWHIECSVMSQEGPGETLDIHGGGVDLVFPHHENEIAQSEAAWRKPFVNYWLHNGLLTVNGEKMAKSVGNVVKVEDILERGYHSDDLKLFFLQSHYRSPVDFNNKRMEEAKKKRFAFEHFLLQCWNYERTGKIRKIQEVTNLRVAFEEAMDDDFNSPKALAVLFELLILGNKALTSQDVILITVVEEELKKLARDVLGLSLKTSPFDRAQLEKHFLYEVEKLVRLRNEARSRKDFKEADEIRTRLKQMDIVIEDGKEGTTWRQKEK